MIKAPSDNLYIYNEDQANYQSLSKFARNRKGNSISDRKKLEDDHYFHNNNNAKFDQRNISESAEFKHDESLNDRDIAGIENELVLEGNEENQKDNEENQQENKENLENQEKIEENIENMENFQEKGYFNSLNANGKAKWLGMKMDFGDTV